MTPLHERSISVVINSRSLTNKTAAQVWVQVPQMQSFLFNFINIYFYKKQTLSNSVVQRLIVCLQNVKVLVQNPATFKLMINIVSNKGPTNTTLIVKAMMALVAKHTLVAELVDKAWTEMWVQIPTQQVGVTQQKGFYTLFLIHSRKPKINE